LNKSLCVERCQAKMFVSKYNIDTKYLIFEAKCSAHSRHLDKHHLNNAAHVTLFLYNFDMSLQLT